MLTAVLDRSTIHSHWLILILSTVEDEEDEVMASGWGEVDNSAFRDDVMVEWGSLLERWDGRDKSRPKQLVKLCRQVRE